MKKAFFALLLLCGAVAMTAGWAYAIPLEEQNDAVPMLPTTSLLQKHGINLKHGLGTSAAVYETTWVGYSGTAHPTAQNWWNIYASNVNRTGVADPANSLWDFEDPSRAHGDSLLGWWPIMHETRPATANTVNSPWSCLDFGNMANNIVPGTSGRTAGVVGVWHADPGAGAGSAVTWLPITGSKSAWCGVRQGGDNSVIDATTHNAFNADIFQGALAGFPRAFPGYARMWDQMLYRDITPVTGQDLQISFLYRTYMSMLYTQPGVTPATSTNPGRRGWFHGDPISLGVGNFINPINDVNAVIDSFQVYIGVPVNDAAATLSDLVPRPVYDTQRRWFSEVLRIFDGPSAPYYELLGKAGVNPALPDTTGHVAFSATIPWATVATITGSALNPTGQLRLVFRSKTNNVGDDYRGDFTSVGGRGAATIDDVTIKWGAAAPVVIGAFEGAEGTADNINNTIGASSTTFWKSTGKPPALYFHAKNLAGLAWHDLCSATPGAPTRTCNMIGNVLDGGNETTFESVGDPSFEAGKQNTFGALSPTIDLTTTVSPNPMGITTATHAGSDDYYLFYDYNSATFNYPNTGILWQYMIMSYPAINTRGTKQWGDMKAPGSVFYQPDPVCYRTFGNFKQLGLVVTSNASGLPDSVRVFIGVQNRPSAYAPGSTNRNPVDGLYFDNLSFAIVNIVGQASDLGQIYSEIWQWYTDAFPVGGPALGSGTTAAALDTCGALVKGSLNIGPTAAENAGILLDILADSVMTTASDAVMVPGDTNSTRVRVDMVFRILPGPGNYQKVSEGASVAPVYPLVANMKLLRRPDNRTTVINPADANDHSFWSEYIRTPGQFSSSNPHPGNQWSEVTWNSVRVDTLELNRFGYANATPGNWMSTIHELDPHYATLGISHPKCFVVDTLAGYTSGNTVCGAAPVWLTDTLNTISPAPPRFRTGWDGTVTTIEGTKVIPDGLLTPGSHVQYFFRKSQIFGYLGYKMNPDTNYIAYQPSETNYDAHRWQQFSILPDRWKDNTYGGDGMASMLFADYNDRQGDEMVWVSVMDSIGGTASKKWGAHNGWHAAPGVDTYTDAVTDPTLLNSFVHKNAQPGSLWDMYGVRATESGGSVGVRLGGRLVSQGIGLLAGKDAKVAPLPAMLTQFYSSISLLSGGSNALGMILGPVAGVEMPEDDIQILTNFLDSGSGRIGKPRGLFISGNGFAEAESSDPAHQTFLSTKLGMSLVSPDYRAASGNPAYCSDLRSTAVIGTSDIYGVGLSCGYTNDVLDFNPFKPGAQNVSFYKTTGPLPEYSASVYHQRDALNDAENYVSLVNGFDIWNLWGTNCSSSIGRSWYMYNMLSKVFGVTNAGWIAPTPVLDVANNANGGQFVNYMRIGNSVVRTGQATVNFGVAAPGRVRVRLYDVTGRVIRTLVDGNLQAGPQSKPWNGLDDNGNQAARGVYFARIDYASGASINGRVVVLR
jgi:hypothetical protein